MVYADMGEVQEKTGVVGDAEIFYCEAFVKSAQEN